MSWDESQGYNDLGLTESYISFVSASLAYITITKNKRKTEINYNIYLH